MLQYVRPIKAPFGSAAFMSVGVSSSPWTEDVPITPDISDSLLNAAPAVPQRDPGSHRKPLAVRVCQASLVRGYILSAPGPRVGAPNQLWFGYCD